MTTMTDLYGFPALRSAAVARGLSSKGTPTFWRMTLSMTGPGLWPQDVSRTGGSAVGG